MFLETENSLNKGPSTKILFSYTSVFEFEWNRGSQQVDLKHEGCDLTRFRVKSYSSISSQTGPLVLFVMGQPLEGKVH
jgi:hypothetical protein